MQEVYLTYNESVDNSISFDGIKVSLNCVFVLFFLEASLFVASLLQQGKYVKSSAGTVMVSIFCNFVEFETRNCRAQARNSKDVYHSRNHLHTIL